MKTFKEFNAKLKEYDQDHADFYAGKDPKKKKMIVPPKDPKYKHGTGVAGQKGNTGNNEKNEEVGTTDEAMLDPSKSKAARLFRQGQKQHDPERQDKAYELRKQANRARAKRKYDKMSPEQKSAKKKADYEWRRGREDQAKSQMAPDVRKSMAHSKGPHQEK